MNGSGSGEGQGRMRKDSVARGRAEGIEEKGASEIRVD